MRISYLAAVLAATALESCSGPGLSDRQRDQAADIAGDVSADPDELAALQARVNDLEREVEELSAKDTADTANIHTLFSKSEWSERAINTLYDNDRKFAARTGLPLEER